jgi:hypothetical protein
MRKNKLLIGLILMNLMVISILSASYQDCIDASDCTGGTEAHCKQDSSGDWYYTCDVIPIDCVTNPSTNLDCTKKCKAGFVYDYTLGSLSKPCCCPDATPFSYQGSCYSVPTPTSDNWFTRKSTCNGMEIINGGTGFWFDGNCYTPNIQAYPTLDSMINAHYNSLEGNPMKYLYCLEGNFFVCTASSPGIYEYVNRGKVINRCGVQCVQNEDCLDNQMCENSVCLNICPTGQTKVKVFAKNYAMIVQQVRLNVTEFVRILVTSLSLFQ